MYLPIIAKNQCVKTLFFISFIKDASHIAIFCFRNVELYAFRRAVSLSYTVARITVARITVARIKITKITVTKITFINVGKVRGSGMATFTAPVIIKRGWPDGASAGHLLF
jgi:hypothetical protein